MCEIWLKSVHRGLLYDYVKYCKTLYFRCILISRFWNVEISLHFNLAFSQCSTGIYQVFDRQTGFSRVFNFAILSYSRNSRKFWCTRKIRVLQYNEFVTFCTFPFLFSCRRLQQKRTNFNAWWLVWRGFAQGSAFWGSPQCAIMFKSRNSPYLWMTISSKLLIRPTRNLKSGFRSAGRLRGPSPSWIFHRTIMFESFEVHLWKLVGISTATTGKWSYDQN